MKRSLFETVMVMAYTSGTAFGRLGFLSAVVGINCTAATGTPSVTLAVTHSDTVDGTFEPVDDKRIFLDAGNKVNLAVGMFQHPVDLLGCKEFVKIAATITGTATATYALALGDKDVNPV